jgi:polar amino acid transport system permease protein
MAGTSFWDNDRALDMLPVLLDGLAVTVKVTLLAFTVSLIVGLMVAIPRFLKVPVLSQVMSTWVWFVRGTPLLVQAYFVFFVLPQYGLRMSVFVTGVIVLGLNYSAYTAEIYRAGLEAVGKGQWEATTALNLPGVYAWRRIILPQAVRTVIPMLGNYLIQMFKDCAILSAIGVAEMLLRTQQFQGNPVEAYTMVGMLYLLISYPAALLVKQMERRYAPSI